MKPKVFIGSSVEGLNVAYALQKNLSHDSEVTVWPQGVFQMSLSSVESLTKVLDNCDFGIFVFTPDDIVKIRGINEQVARDNVLFEFGLFIGKLTRARVFMVVPDNTDLHIASDLIGLTPGKYETARTDGNLEAATGPVSMQIRNQMREQGPIKRQSEAAPGSTEEMTTDDPTSDNWFALFREKKYGDAMKLINTEIDKLTHEGKSIAEINVWKGYIMCHLNFDEGEAFLRNLVHEDSRNIDLRVLVSMTFLWQKRPEISLKLVEEEAKKNTSSVKLTQHLATCYNAIDGQERAEEYIRSLPNLHVPELAIQLTDFLDPKDFEGARAILHPSYVKNPTHELLRYRYGKLLMDLGEPKSALFLFYELSEEFPENYEYHGYVSNACVSLDLNDFAYVECSRANDMTLSAETWILSNLGNILKNRGLFTEALKYFHKSNVIDNEREYAHHRIAEALNSRQIESDLFFKMVKEGKALLRSYRQDDAPTLFFNNS